MQLSCLLPKVLEAGCEYRSQGKIEAEIAEVLKLMLKVGGNEQTLRAVLTKVAEGTAFTEQRGSGSHHSFKDNPSVLEWTRDFIRNNSAPTRSQPERRDKNGNLISPAVRGRRPLTLDDVTWAVNKHLWEAVRAYRWASNPDDVPDPSHVPHWAGGRQEPANVNEDALQVPEQHVTAEDADNDDDGSVDDDSSDDDTASTTSSASAIEKQLEADFEAGEPRENMNLRPVDRAMNINGQVGVDYDIYGVRRPASRGGAAAPEAARERTVYVCMFERNERPTLWSFSHFRSMNPASRKVAFGHTPISPRTIARIIRMLGFLLSRRKKIVYKLGFDRKDVQQHTDEYFIPLIKKLAPLKVKRWHARTVHRLNHGPADSSEFFSRSELAEMDVEYIVIDGVQQKPIVVLPQDEVMYNASGGNSRCYRHADFAIVGEKMPNSEHGPAAMVSLIMDASGVVHLVRQIVDRAAHYEPVHRADEAGQERSAMAAASVADGSQQRPRKGW